MEPRKEKPSTSKKKKAKVEEASTIQKDAVIERNRRGQMNSLYSELHSMLPCLNPKATTTNIIDGAISYIRDLENVVNELEQRKKVEYNRCINLQTLQTSSVTMTVSGTTAFFGIQSLAWPGLVTRALHVFHKHKAEVLAVGVARNGFEMMTTVTATINGTEDSIAMIKGDLLMCLS